MTLGIIGQGFGSAVYHDMKDFYDMATFDINGN